MQLKIVENKYLNIIRKFEIERFLKSTFEAIYIVYYTVKIVEDRYLNIIRNLK